MRSPKHLKAGVNSGIQIPLLAWDKFSLFRGTSRFLNQPMARCGLHTACGSEPDPCAACALRPLPTTCLVMADLLCLTNPTFAGLIEEESYLRPSCPGVFKHQLKIILREARSVRKVELTWVGFDWLCHPRMGECKNCRRKVG